MLNLICVIWDGWLNFKKQIDNKKIKEMLQNILRYMYPEGELALFFCICE